MEYIKINTLWKRDEKTQIIEGDFSKDEFNSIKLWDVSEKINGTNIRITYNRIGNIQFDGKTDNARIPTKLYAYLQSKFTLELMETTFPLENKELEVKPQKSQVVILFGEGVGAGIKGSGQYFKDKGIGFILFDVYIDGWWLERENVIDIANKLGVKYAPELGIMDVQSAINLVKQPRNSSVSELPMTSEGVVARSHPLMLFRDGKPIMWKLKVSDYKK